MSNVKPLSPAQRKRVEALKEAHDSAQREFMAFFQYLVEEHEVPVDQGWTLQVDLGAFVQSAAPAKEGE